MEIKKDVFYVGVSNETLRLFDVTMQTEYGTSYNSYLIKDEKNTLIDTVHEDFFEEYIKNIEKYVSIKDISYLVVNHAEPDHSGSISKLLELNPNIQIYSSQGACMNIKNICNKELNVKTVKNDEVLNTGKKNITFKLAPFLHWPDTMFSYIDDIIFTGDFLGAHYSECRILTSTIHDRDAYLKSVRFYFDVIFNPFKTYVSKGLEIVNGLLEINKNYIIAPSHGPIIDKDLNKIIEIYKEKLKKSKENKISIIYVSAYGYTKKLAEETYNYLKKKYNYKLVFIDAASEDLEYIKEEIDTSKAIFIGSPTINRDAIKPIWDTLSVVDVYINKGLPVGVFGSYGWSGEAVPMIISRLKLLGLNPIEEGVKVAFNPTKEDIKLMHKYTDKVLESVK